MADDCKSSSTAHQRSNRALILSAISLGDDQRKTSDAPAKIRRHTCALSSWAPQIGTAKTRFSRLGLISRRNSYKSSSTLEKQTIPSPDGALMSNERRAMPVLDKPSSTAFLTARSCGPQKWIQGAWRINPPALVETRCGCASLRLGRN